MSVRTKQNCLDWNWIVVAQQQVEKQHCFDDYDAYFDEPIAGCWTVALVEKIVDCMNVGYSSCC